jgi:hypothetical protein
MTHPALVGILLLGAICGIGCDSSPDLAPSAPPSGYPLAFVMHDCAPWDGPAIAIVLTSHALDNVEAAHPLARVVVYPRGESIAGHTYRWPSEPEMAVGSRCVSEDSCEMATAGQVTLRTVRPDTSMDGRVLLRFANGEEIAGSFRAVWLPRRAMCG